MSIRSLLLWWALSGESNVPELARLAAWVGLPEPYRLHELATGDLVWVEEWEAGCLAAMPELRGIDDPGEFEEAAFAWLGAHEGEVAREIAARHGRSLLGWWHDADSADDSPYGATVVVLERAAAGSCPNQFINREMP